MDDDQTEVKTAPKSQSLAIPVAIIFGFGLIAAAIFFSGNNSEPADETTTGSDQQVVDINDPNAATLNPVTEDDHIKGNPNAPILIVEYSDFDCPFCKLFHETMNRIIDEYGATGQVAWVYRHLPLQNLHPSAPFIAEASECVASLGGDEAFWSFADQVFAERGTNEPTNVARLPEFAETAGVDVAAYEACLDNNEKRADVQEDFDNAFGMGIRGTPHSFILIGDQEFPLNGARPYNEVKSYMDSLIRQLGGQEPAEETEEAEA